MGGARREVLSSAGSSAQAKLARATVRARSLDPPGGAIGRVGIRSRARAAPSGDVSRRGQAPDVAARACGVRVWSSWGLPETARAVVGSQRCRGAPWAKPQRISRSGLSSVPCRKRHARQRSMAVGPYSGQHTRPASTAICAGAASNLSFMGGSDSSSSLRSSTYGCEAAALMATGTRLTGNSIRVFVSLGGTSGSLR